MLNLAHHKKSCSAGTLFCTQYPQFSTKSRIDQNYQIAMKHSAQKLMLPSSENCYQEFPGFYALRQHKNTHHGFPAKTAKIDPDDIVNEVDDTNLEEDLRSYQYFFVDLEHEWLRQKAFNYAIENLQSKIVGKKLDHFFSNSNRAAKLNLAFRFVFGDIENLGFRNFYATKTKPCGNDRNVCAPRTTWQS